jgi:hypothetical protein
VGSGIEQLISLRRADSAAKVTRVLAALDAMICSGDPPHIAALARRAGVSRRFVYDHPEIKAEVERRSAEVADRHSGALMASARVSAASLRADLENSKATNHRLQSELAALRRRLGKALGQEVLSDLSDGRVDATDPKIAAHIEQIEQTLFETREELARRCDELEAARQINRELMARLNHEPK